jgi:hypothetical protein
MRNIFLDEKKRRAIELCKAEASEQGLIHVCGNPKGHDGDHRCGLSNCKFTWKKT